VKLRVSTLLGVMHFDQPVLTTPPPVPPSVVGASTLVRTAHGVSTKVETSALAPGDAVTLWWIVFNNPDACHHSFAG
jgi:hypothetical protein